MSKKSISVIKCVLTGAFNHAEHPWELIKVNPTKHVRMPKFDEAPKDREDLKIITLEQFQEILQLVPPWHTFYLPLNIGFYTGMRVSEVTGLTWDCVDFDNKTIRVEKILVNQDKQWVFGTPKTKSSYRTIDLGETLIEILKQQQDYQLQNQKKYGPHYTFNEFVCKKENGTNITPASVKSSTSWAQKKTGIDFHFHSLRHTHATLLIEAGANMKMVSRRLGHSRIGITIDTYTHITDKMRSDTVDIFEKAITIN